MLNEVAHEIRNGATTRSKAICALKGDRRWAVTGTPIQNRMQDLAGLLGFLQVFPGGDLKKLVSDVTVLRALTCLCLRRINTTIELPERVDGIHFVDFDTEEAAEYESVNQTIISLLESSLANNAPRSYSNILSRINALRQICNLGSAYQQGISPTKRDIHNDRDAMQGIFDNMLSAGDTQCGWCGHDVSRDTDELQEGLRNAGSQYAASLRLSSCGELACTSCVYEKTASKGILTQFCSHGAPCTSQEVSLIDLRTPNPSETSKSRISSKVRCLQQDLLTVPVTDKR